MGAVNKAMEEPGDLSSKGVDFSSTAPQSAGYRKLTPKAEFP